MLVISTILMGSPHACINIFQVWFISIERREVFHRWTISQDNLSWRKLHKHDDVIKWKHLPRYCPFVWGESISDRSPLPKASDAELCCFLWSAPEQPVEHTVEAPVIRDAIALIMASLLWFTPVWTSMQHEPGATQVLDKRILAP